MRFGHLALVLLALAEGAGAAPLPSVLKDDVGGPGPHPVQTTAETYRYPDSEVPFAGVGADDPARTIVFGPTVQCRIRGLPSDGNVRLRLTFLSDSADRRLSVEFAGRVLEADLALPEDRPLIREYVIPPGARLDGGGALVLRSLSGANAVLSAVEVLSDRPLTAWLDVTLDGRLGGRVEGRVTGPDGRAAAGASITLKCGEGRTGVVCRAGRDGRYRAALPESWSGFQGLLRAEAVTGGARGTASLPVACAFIQEPRLTPRPEPVRGKGIGVWKSDTPWWFSPTVRAGVVPSKDDGRTEWKPIQVPGEWEMQGFSVPPGGTAAYSLNLVVPGKWLGRRFRVRFGAVYSECDVFVNRKRVGGHAIGFTPFEVDITDAVRVGGNELLVLVRADSAADVLASGNQYAAHSLGGILRDVELLVLPSMHVSGLKVETTFDREYRDGRLKLDVTLTNEGSRRAEGRVSLKLFRGNTRLAGSVRGEPVSIPALGSAHRALLLDVKDVSAWDPEHPSRYTAVLSVERNGLPVEAVHQKVGFRQVEVRGNQLLVNGRPVKLRGVCRHDAHPATGRALTEAQCRRDAELYREANVNYVRTSHYPPDERFIEACDESGIFVEVEAPLCWIGHGANGFWRTNDPADPRWQPLIVQAMLETVQRDRNHPSVILWSLANESLWTPNFARSLEECRRFDPTRPQSFHDQCWAGFNNAGSRAPVAVYHYPGIRDAARPDDLGRPLLFGEYCHLNCYNREELAADPGLREAWGPLYAKMWDAVYNAPGTVGGAIWSGIDDQFALPDGRIVGYGEWGPIDGWRRRKPEWWHIRNAYAPIKVLDERLPIPATGEPLKVRVENRSIFSNLGEYHVEWSVAGASGGARAAAEPGQAGVLEIMPGRILRDGDVLELRFRDPRRFECFSCRLPVGAPLSAEEPEGVAAPPWAVNTATGALESAGILRGGPWPCLVPMRFGDGQLGTEPVTAYIPVSTDWRTARVTVTGSVTRVEGSCAETEGWYEAQPEPGGLQLRYRFTLRQDLNPRQWGIAFALDPACDTLEWKRDVPWSDYPDGHIGRPEGTATGGPARRPPAMAGRVEPDWAWEAEGNDLGSNDFRSTRDGVRFVALTAPDGRALRVVSDGRHSARAWMTPDGPMLLVAAYSNAGSEGFFGGQSAHLRRPLKAGDTIEDTVHLRLLPIAGAGNAPGPFTPRP